MFYETKTANCNNFENLKVLYFAQALSFKSNENVNDKTILPFLMTYCERLI